MSAREVAIKLSQAERQALLQWNFTPEVRDQLEPLAGWRGVESIRITRTDLRWLISDLNHAIVKRGCRDDIVIDLCERLEYIERTSDSRYGY